MTDRVRRALVAVAVAATLAPAPAAVASCHGCVLPVDCAEAACDPLYDLLASLESRESHDLLHALCGAACHP